MFLLAVPSWLCRVLAHKLFSWEKQSERLIQFRHILLSLASGK